MNIIYISFDDFENKSMCGVRKKIMGQINALRGLGNNVKYTFFEGNKLICCDENDNKSILGRFNGILEKRIKRYKEIEKFILDSKNINSIYIRYPFSDMYLINFLKKMKSRNIKVYIEIPTYPYDTENILKIRSIKKVIWILMDRAYRSRLSQYVYRMVITSDDYNEVFGIKTIKIDNGIDINSIAKKKSELNKDKKEINLIAVAFVSHWHGYDRIINGMNEFYKNKKNNITVNFKIIGNGSELNNLKLMVEKYKLHEHVFFEGVKTGIDLEKQYEWADIAIGSLGIHRSNINTVATLKLREYCAKGIPFVYAGNDPAFSGNEEFLKLVSSDESYIDISDILKFYESILSKSNIKNDMRQYAENKFDWKIQMNKVMNL